MGKLRQKLDDALPGRRFIHTHFGFGYRFQPETERLGNGRLYIPFTSRRQVRNRLVAGALRASPPSR